MTDVEILKAARALIEDKKRWTRLMFARRKGGRPTSATSPSAVKWCAFGATLHVAPNGHLRVQLILQAAAESYGHNVAWVNDFTNHATVLRMFDRAIELAEQGAVLMVKPTDALRTPPVAQQIRVLIEAQERDRKIIQDARARMAERDKIINRLRGGNDG